MIGYLRFYLFVFLVLCCTGFLCWAIWEFQLRKEKELMISDILKQKELDIAAILKQKELDIAEILEEQKQARNKLISDSREDFEDKEQKIRALEATLSEVHKKYGKLDVSLEKANQDNKSDFQNEGVCQNAVLTEIELPVIPQKISQPIRSMVDTYKAKDNNYIAYYKNGTLYDVFPRDPSITLDENRQIAYDARYIVSDGIKYDLNNPEDILKIKIPNFNSISGMPYVVRDMAYIMKMKANAERNTTLAVPLVYKAANLMLASPISWSKKDYYQIIKHLWTIGEITYADYLLAELDKRNALQEFSIRKSSNFSDYYDKNSLYYKSDLIESNDTECVCSECAKYTKRIFSEFGFNKKYPKLPQYFKSNDDKHKYCCISFYPVLEDISIPMWDYTGNLVKFCNREFKDTRTPEEKEHFETYKARRMQEDEAKERYYNREYWIDIYKKHLEYQQIVELLGDVAPKSYSGYMRMKKNNTKNYQKIVQIAQKNNIHIL
nr:MAG TPA: hypothetical protein [Caudoviricetes sp.]